MPQRRPPVSHELARRFLQLDADIRLAAAADGLFPFEKDRPESPHKTYPYDAQLQHPKPKPAHGPIKILQLEHVAKAKPSLKTRSVSDPGDAHRLISRFVQEKHRTLTSQSSPPASPSARAFPFPSMAIRKGPQLEDFLELESTADELGPDNPLAVKMGQILARRAAAATRAISGSSRRSSRPSSVISGRRSVDSNGRRSIRSSDSQRSRLRIESLLDAMGEGSKPASQPAKRDPMLLAPPPVVVDDRSPQEGPVHTRFWPRAPKAKGVPVSGVGSATHQPPGADDSLNTFTFPSMPSEHPHLAEPESEPPAWYFGSQPPPHFGANPTFGSYQVQIQTRVPLTVQTNLDPPASPVMFQEDARSVSFVMQSSPTSGVYVSPVESMGSPRFSRSFGETSFEGASISFEGVAFGGHSFERPSLEGSRGYEPVTTSPTTSRVQTSPRVQQSPTTARVLSSPTAIRVQASPTNMRIHTVQSSPTALRIQPPPVTMTVQTSPTAMRVQASPNTMRIQTSPITTRVQQSPLSARFQNTPTATRFQHQHSASTSRIPIVRQMASSDSRYHSSPTTVYSQPSPATPFQSGIPVRSSGTPLRTNGTPIQRPPSNAHMDLLRGLSPLPSHGLPLPPAPVKPTLKRGSLLGDAFIGSSLAGFGAQGNTSSSTREAPALDVSAQAAATSALIPHDSISPEEPSLVPDPTATSIRDWSPPPPSTPPPPPGHVPSTPNLFSTPNAISTPIASRVSRIPVPTTAPAAFPTFPTPIRGTSPSPVRALSPIPARLRRATPDAGSASDEVVFRGTSSSASSTPQKRKRRRTRLPVRAHSEGFLGLGRGVASESLARARSGNGTARRTAQSLMRRGLNGDAGEVSSDGKDVVLFVPKSMGPPSRAPSPNKPLSRPPSPVKVGSPFKLARTESPSKIPVRIGSPTKLSSRSQSPVKQPVASTSRSIPPPLVRRASIPLPESSPTQQAPPPALGLLGAEPFMTSSRELPRRPSIELGEPIIIQPRPVQRLDRVPWSPPRHVQSRMETASREGSFHTARDSPAQTTELEFPTSFPLVGTPPVMDGESTTVHSAVTAEENSFVHSAVRGTVARPVTMTITRRPSHEFGPTPPGSTTPARRPTSAHSFRPITRPPASLAPSPSFPGPSLTPNSSNGGSSNQHMASIPVRRDQHYSPPGSLPESVTPPTEASRPPTERSNSHLEDETFYSVHASDSDIRLPVENWIAFTMNNMDANGLPITRETFDEFQSSEDEGAAVAEVLSRNSVRRSESPLVLDALPPHDDDNDSGESAGQSLSDVGTTPSPSRSGSRHSGFLAPPATTLTVQTSGLDWPEDDGNTSAFSINSDTSESNRLTVDQLQTVASIVHELNVRTPIPSASSSQLRGPPSLATTSAAYVTPPLFVNPPPYHAAHSAPSRTLSPGAVSITFSEASPSLSSVPPPSLVVPSENRNWFADNLLLGEYRRSLHYLRDDDQRALEEGEDVILYGGDWEHVGRRSESRATTNSAIPIEVPSDFDPATADPQSRNKYLQFLLSFAGALRHQGPPRSQRMVESALRTLRRQPSQPGPRYPADLYDEIGRDEAEIVVPVPGPPRLPSHISSTSSSSSDIGSALPDDDEIVEEFVRSIVTPQPGTPRRTPAPILIQQGSNVLPWPALPSPVSPRIRFARSVSRQTARSQATSVTTTQQSGYSSLIPPPPRPRPRSIEPHWLTIYVARRWPVPDTYVTRRTYSSPSALGPPMPYLWRPICHISPERLWEITNLEVQVPMPPPIPPPAQEPPNARQHFPTPATTQNHATYSMSSASTSSSRSSRSNMMLPPPPAIYPEVVFQTSHANLQIDSLSALPPLPPSAQTFMEHLSNTSIPLPHRPRHMASRLSVGGSSVSSRPSRPSTRSRPASRIVTPVATRRRTLKEFVSKIVGGNSPYTRTRTRSIHSRSSGPYVPKPKFGVAGKVVEVTRRIFRRGRRARLSSVRSQAQRATPET